MCFLPIVQLFNFGFNTRASNYYTIINYTINLLIKQDVGDLEVHLQILNLEKVETKV